MEEIKSVATNYIYFRDIYDKTYVCNLFENGNLDYLYVLDDNDDIIGIYYLEDFCNTEEIIIEKHIPNEKNITTEENLLLNKIKTLKEIELEYIRNEIYKKMGNIFVCCCSDIFKAQYMLKLIFFDLDVNVKFVNRIDELNTNDNVLFSTYKMIKLYRKMHKNNIKSLVALNNLIMNSINRTFYYDKYPELIDFFNSSNVGFLYGIIPEKEMLSCLSQNAKERIAGFGKIDYGFHKQLLGSNTGDYISCMEQKKYSRVMSNGIHKVLVDCNSTFYNVVNGMRITTNQPEHFKNTIYIFGPCTVRGALVEDKNTIASILQNIINSNKLPYIVMNCGVGGGTDLENTYRYILSLPIKPGDFVVLIEEGEFLYDIAINKNQIVKLSDEFNKIKLNSEWFLDRPAHCNSEANRIISKHIFKYIKKFVQNNNHADSSVLQLFKGEKKIFDKSKELEQYVEYLISNRFIIDEKRIVGSITMHCNPFTKGHKYLIEKALENVDYLYIFILSEDKSEIPFSLRKKLLLHEVEDYSNVRVMECGGFMASTMTFPEYFSKEINKKTRVDASKDILTFCQYVAPTLNITKRFVGTENRDFVTRQYNCQLKVLLPMYGIEVCEIKRVESSIGSISAHTTRSLIKKNDWINASEMVTDYVLNELKTYYMGKNNGQ